MLEGKARKAALVRENRKKHLKAMLENPDDKRHGTRTGYLYGCRCEKCSGTWSDRQKDYYKRLLVRLEDPNHELHGTTTGYNAGCRCEKCKKRNSQYKKRYALNKLRAER